ncbi:MAG: efflux RND transporter permease subunit [Gemmatimonadetes bacterium]|nr:MAG: efflux RND transporter permease subunit [Gemmatimonadota bacterium]
MDHDPAKLNIELSHIRKNWIPLFSVRRPVTVVTLLASLLVVGFIAYTRIPLEMMPRGLSFPYLGVYVPYPNSTPQETEELVTKPVEEMMRTVSGIEEMSTDTSDQGVWCGMMFQQHVDVDEAYAQIRDRTERLMAELPEEVERIYLRKFSQDDDPVIWFVTSYDENAVPDPFFLLDTHVRRRLERVAGVAKVEVWGVEQKEIMIDVDQDRVRALNVNLYQVIQALQRDNFTMTSGFVNDGGKKLYVRSIGRLPDISEIQNMPVGNRGVQLKDIATITYDIPGYRWFQRAGRQKAVQFGVYKTSMANTAETCGEVERILHEEIETHPSLAPFQFDILYNQGDYVKESIQNLVNTALWGGFFAFIVLFIFLRRFRMTLIINLAIPLSLLITVTILYFMGWTLNAITMMGLMISVGLVVDNAIVIVENIYRMKAEGLTAQDSAILGASEVGLAITLATLTTVVVFLPLMLMGDNAIMAWYMLRLGLPVVLALIASLCVALVFIPLAATKVTSSKPVKPSRVINTMLGWYEAALRWTLTHRADTTIIVIGLLISMGWASSQLGMTDEEGHINNFNVWVDFPSNNSIQRTYDIVRAIEDTVYAHAEEYRLRTVSTNFRRTQARFNVFLQAPPKYQWYDTLYQGVRQLLGIPVPRIMTRNAVIEDVKKRLPEFPGVEYRFGWQSGSGNNAAVNITLTGDDTQTLFELAQEVKRRIQSIPEVVSAEIDLESGYDEIQVKLNRELSQKYGFDPQVIVGTLRYALAGLDLPDYRTPDQEIPMSIGLQPEDRRNLHQLKNLTISSMTGNLMPLDTFADFHIAKGMGSIKRINGKTSIRVSAMTQEADLEALGNKIKHVMKDFQPPRGYEWQMGQRFRRLEQSGESQLFAMILAITFVFLLMGTLFESFLLPIAVIISIPLSFFGAYWMLYLTDTPMSMMVGIGLVILVGIVVNNAIVLVDMINRFRLAGYTRFDAILEAGKHRFRPILMTAFTTMFGLLPMALGNSAVVGMPYAPMGRALIGGLLTSTFLTLTVVPLFYVYLDDLRMWLKAMWGHSRWSSPRYPNGN